MTLFPGTQVGPFEIVSELGAGGMGVEGRREEARKVLRDLDQRREEGSFSGFLLALVHLGLEDRDEAVSALQRAEEERDVLIPFINVWPALDPLRSDPRFQDLVRRMNFPQQAEG